MAGKRASGAGRKPKGPFKGKSVTITTRVTPRTRTELEREAKKKGHSLSQEIERRLDDLLRRDLDTPAHIKALAQAVTVLARNIERATGRQWRDDAFTGEALRNGIEMLIRHFAPATESPAVPPQIDEAATKMQPELRAPYSNPKLFGWNESGMVISMIESAPTDTVYVPGIEFPDPQGYAQIRRDIGSGWQRNQKIWNKETK